MPNPKSLLLSPDGRISRLTYWLSMLSIIVTGALVGFVPIIGPLLGLALLWPFACIGSKRMHDMGRSAWPIGALAVLSAFVGATTVIAGALAPSSAHLLSVVVLSGLTAGLGAVTALAGLVVMVWIGLAASDPETNRYGERADIVLSRPI